MTAFLVTMFVLHVIAAGINIGNLSNKSYPFVKTTSKGDDIAGFLFAILFAVWAGILLF